MTRWCAFVAVLALVPRPSIDERSPANDNEKLRGWWRIVATEFDGKPMSADAIKSREIEFEDSKFKVIVAGTVRRTLKFTVDATKQPKQIDITNPDKNETAAGIYVFDKDELKLCYGEPGNARTKDFKSPPGERIYLLRLKRDKQP